MIENPATPLQRPTPDARPAPAAMPQGLADGANTPPAFVDSHPPSPTVDAARATHTSANAAPHAPAQASNAAPRAAPTSTPTSASAAAANPAPDTDTTPPAAPVAPAPVAKTVKPSAFSIIAMLMVAAAGILLILWAWHLGPFATVMVRTDNAYVRGQITVMAPQVSGYVKEVLVQDFQRVQAGEPLVRIDDRVYEQKVHAAQAQLESAQAQLANGSQTQAQNRANLGSRQASLMASEAEARRAKADLQRADDLAARGSVSLRERDQARATYELANANVRKARADITIGEQTIKSTTVSRAGLEAQVQAAQAQLGLARIDLANTTVRAPRAGQLGEASVRLGQYVTAGSQLMFLVPDALWVVANFKETQTAHMQIGQPARFKVDGLDGAELTGRINEIAPATGSEFSVLRADNATGNFTKVVQRLQVRIALDPDQPLAKGLRPGMSVVAEVDTSMQPSAEPPGAAQAGDPAGPASAAPAAAATQPSPSGVAR